MTSSSPATIQPVNGYSYRLRTLMMLAGVGPPGIAVLWFHWRQLLVVAVCIATLCLWVWISLSLARFFAALVASVMD